MKKVFALLFLFVSMAAYAQMPSGNQGQMSLKGGYPVINGEKITSRDAIIGLIGKDTYENDWKKAASLRKTGKTLTIAGGVVFGYGLASYITAICIPWPEAEAEPERYDKFSKAFTFTKILCGVGAVTLGAGIPLFCVGNNRLKDIRDQYNLTVSAVPGGLSLSYCF